MKRTARKRSVFALLAVVVATLASTGACDDSSTTTTPPTAEPDAQPSARCANVGCAPPPACGQACTAPCGCCPNWSCHGDAEADADGASTPDATDGAADDGG